MQYCGGKHRIAKKISEVIRERIGGANIIEPFCGGLSASVMLRPKIASDSSKSIICLYNAVRVGWDPPSEVNKEMYDKAVRGECSPELTGFIGHACSFGGKWFGGFARNARGDNYALQSRNGLIKKLSKIPHTIFEHADFLTSSYEKGDVLYCDPPYRGVTQAYESKRFNHNSFYKNCRDLANKGVLLFISEYSMPEDFHIIAEFPSKLDMRRTDVSNVVIEKLFTIGG